jgi:hypothetical protein
MQHTRIVKIVVNDKQRRKVLGEFCTKLRELVKLSSNLTLLQDRLDHIVMKRDGVIVLEVTIIIVPCTMYIERLYGIHPSETTRIDARLLLEELDSYKRQVCSLTNNHAIPAIKCMDWSMDNG